MLAIKLEQACLLKEIKFMFPTTFDLPCIRRSDQLFLCWQFYGDR